ncbi:MAG: ribosome small subunit-dependent GTPase A [Chloroflexi bacterium]|nr:ribosome small subunit-dependent GTPase A [Chloroflexota bacterium]
MTDEAEYQKRKSEQPADHLKAQKVIGRHQFRGKTNKLSLKRNIDPKAPRTKRWDAVSEEEWDDTADDQLERVMPLDESDRRREMEEAAFRAEAGRSVESGGREEAVDGHGLVISMAKGLCLVQVGDTRLQCRIRGSLNSVQSGFTNAVAVGDKVLVGDDGAGGGVIDEVLPRRNVLARSSVPARHLRQIVVANAEQLLIVSSWREPIIWPELIDRYLIAAERSGLDPVICVNKIDLAADSAEIAETVRIYNDLDIRVVLSSAATGEGVGQLRDILTGRMTVLAGLSGTGKSSLAAAVEPGLDLKTAAVSEGTGEGKHTTTGATLFPLSSGGALVDTPGIREFGLAGLRRRELAGLFPELEGLVSDCRFFDCTHLAGPDCAVLAGVDRGAVAASRYHSYKKIYPTLPE